MTPYENPRSEFYKLRPPPYEDPRLRLLKPHIKKLESGSYGYFSNREAALPCIVANDIDSISVMLGRGCYRIGCAGTPT